MTVKSFRYIAIFLIFGLLADSAKSPGSAGKSCMTPTLASIPSPMPQRRYELDPKYPPSPSMPDWWQPQLNLFERMRYGYELGQYSTSLIDFVIQNNDLWIAYSTTVVRYNTLTEELMYYQVSRSDGNNISFRDLFVTTDGNLWAGEYVFDDDGYLALAHFNPQTNSFVLVTDQDGLMSKARAKSEIEWDAFNILAEFPSGELAIATGGDIYSYDIKSNTAKKIFGDSQGFKVKTFAISQTGSIWFTVQSMDDLDIREYDPQTQQVYDYGPALVSLDDLAANDIAVKMLFVDSQNRVWDSYFSRLEPSQTKRYEWKLVDRSPIFVTPYISDFTYGWAYGSDTIQLSDGNIWMSTGVGIVKYDTKTDQWCWSSPQGANVVEDKNGNLWIVSGTQIYKSKIQ